MWALGQCLSGIHMPGLCKQTLSKKKVKHEHAKAGSSLAGVSSPICASRSAHVDGLTPAATGVTVVSETVYPRPPFSVPLSFDLRFVIPVGGLISTLHPCGVGERSRKSLLWLNRVS